MNDTTRRLLTSVHQSTVAMIESKERQRGELLQELEQLDKAIEHFKREAREIEQTWDEFAYGPIPARPAAQDCAMSPMRQAGPPVNDTWTP